MNIETQNLLLVEGTSELLQAGITSNEALSAYLKVSVLDDWTEFGTAALEYSKNKLEENPSDEGWWTYLVIHRRENALIGSCGYKGRPNEEGIVEIGYEISPSYRNQGLATEVARGLMHHALRHNEVRGVIAHTLAEINPSTKVLSKCGFDQTEELHDPEDGYIWKWEYDPT